MNARDGFAMWLTGLLAYTSLDDKIQTTQEAMDEAFDDFARELAAKIHRWADEANIPGSPVTTEMIRGLRHAADLINIPEEA